jgi:hypothetical protein
MEFVEKENRSGAANATDGFVILPRKDFHHLVNQLHNLQLQLPGTDRSAKT